MNNIFDLSDKVVLITGAAGLLGPKHAEAILEFGGKVLLTDISFDKLQYEAKKLQSKFGIDNIYYEYMDITNVSTIYNCLNTFPFKINTLINNATQDPKITINKKIDNSMRFETMTEQFWKEGLNVAINGTFLITQFIINQMLTNTIHGSIINIASDLSIIAPDQRIYKQNNVKDDEQPVKPITYSVAKHAIIGMTKYLATYFADKNIRINALSFSGVYNNHPSEFVSKLTNLIPMNRMANIDEYKGAIVFLCSEASSYMTGTNLIIDGGRTIW